MVAAQVDDLIAHGLKRSEGALGDVLHIGEVARLGPVAVEVEGLPFRDCSPVGKIGV